MPCKPVHEVVLAAMRLVGNDDDVAPLREQRMPVAFLVGKELLDRREHDAARLDREPRAQVGAALDLRRRLPQQIGAASESAEELVVEIVAVSQHDDGGVLHRRIANESAGIERHRQALA